MNPEKETEDNGGRPYLELTPRHESNNVCALFIPCWEFDGLYNVKKNKEVAYPLLGMIYAVLTSRGSNTSGPSLGQTVALRVCVNS